MFSASSLFRFLSGFHLWLLSSSHPQHLFVCPILDLRLNGSTRSRPYPIFLFTNLIQSTGHPPTAFLYPYTYRIRLHVHNVTRQSTFLVFHLGFMYILVVSSRRLKRPLSSSLYRTLHHFTSIPPIPGTSLYSISRPFAFLGFLRGFSFTLHLRRIPQSSSHPLYLTNSYPPHTPSLFHTHNCMRILPQILVYEIIKRAPGSNLSHDDLEPKRATAHDSFTPSPHHPGKVASHSRLSLVVTRQGCFQSRSSQVVTPHSSYVTDLKNYLLMRTVFSGTCERQQNFVSESQLLQFSKGGWRGGS